MTDILKLPAAAWPSSPEKIDHDLNCCSGVTNTDELPLILIISTINCFLAAIFHYILHFVILWTVRHLLKTLRADLISYFRCNKRQHCKRFFLFEIQKEKVRNNLLCLRSCKKNNNIKYIFSVSFV